MGLTPEEVGRLGESAKRLIRQKQIHQDTVSEAEFSKQLFAHGIKSYWRNWPQKSRGESWPAPVEKNWQLDFAWIGLHRPMIGDSSLGIFLDGKAHMFTPGDKLAGTGGKRTADYKRVNVLQHVLGPLGWTLLYFTPSDIGQGVALRSVQAWLKGDDEALLMALQGKVV